jgi:hypothetical protein
MDYPFVRKTHYNVSNNWWFLPTDLFKTEQDKENMTKTIRKSPLVTYFDDISRKDLFKYILITFIVVLLFYRLNLHWSIWIGLLIGLVFVYYLHERQALELNVDADQMWAVLKSPLLKNTKYFITDPQFIQWVGDVSDLKQYNVLEFNKMITSLDRFLKLVYEIKIGVKLCKENLDLAHDYKVTCLNQFHSMIYKINNADLRTKYNYYLEQLGLLLNERHMNLIKICNMYYLMKPITIESHFDVTGMDEPTAHDHMYDKNYNYYN